MAEAMVDEGSQQAVERSGDALRAEVVWEFEDTGFWEEHPELLKGEDEG